VSTPAKMVQPIHFEDLSGEQFEGLAFAYHMRVNSEHAWEWYGQVGSDLGRDIWGAPKGGAGESICVQCVNRGRLTGTKAARDLAKAASAPGGKPGLFRFVCRSQVSAKMRDQIKAHARRIGITQCEIWSGSEFEEHLRRDTESLLARFVEGVEFPDVPDKLEAFVTRVSASNDTDAIRLMVRLFDRPAFHTPIDRESSLPDFKQAITDTIQALNTGIWQTRDGKEIGRIPSRHSVADGGMRKRLTELERGLAQLRAVYDDLERSGDLRPCGNCIELSHRGVHQLEDARSHVLSQFRSICDLHGIALDLTWNRRGP
jgi:hypothetical protein